MKLKKYLIPILAFILILSIAVSCVPARRTVPYNTQNPAGTRQTRFVPRTTPGQVDQGGLPTPGFTNRPMTRPAPRRITGMTDGADTNMQERSKIIARDVAQLKEIEKATCVITGDTAMIGVQFDKQYKGKLTDRIKKEVDREVKSTDKRIKRVAVSADPDVVSRLDSIFKDIERGKPVSGFADELREMINRIIPK